MLRDTFYKLLLTCTPDVTIVDEQWQYLETQYGSKNRHYHTLTHLKNMLTELTEVKKEIEDWDTLLFSLFYHDVIYNPLQSDNEEKSAQVAAEVLQQLAVSKGKIEKCRDQILATKKHTKDSKPDTNFLLDADVAILGYRWDSYQRYAAAIRKEYRVVPDIFFYKKRKEILAHFLQEDSIYKTAHFRGKYEQQARMNLKNEMALLEA